MRPRSVVPAFSRTSSTGAKKTYRLVVGRHFVPLFPLDSILVSQAKLENQHFTITFWDVTAEGMPTRYYQPVVMSRNCLSVLPTEIKARRIQLLREKCEFQKKLIEIETELEIHELESDHHLLLATADREVPGTQQSECIERNRDKLELSDLEFLEEEFRGPSAVAKYWGRSIATVQRRCSDGTFTFNVVDGARQISTVSVVEFVLNGKTSEAD